MVRHDGDVVAAAGDGDAVVAAVVAVVGKSGRSFAQNVVELRGVEHDAQMMASVGEEQRQAGKVALQEVSWQLALRDGCSEPV